MSVTATTGLLHSELHYESRTLNKDTVASLNIVNIGKTIACCCSIRDDEAVCLLSDISLAVEGIKARISISRERNQNYIGSLSGSQDYLTSSCLCISICICICPCAIVCSSNSLTLVTYEYVT